MEKKILDKTQKHIHLTKSLIFAHLHDTALFVRLIPTDNCNLNCRYCYQKKNNAPNMTWDLFSRVFQKAKELRLGFMSFLGGEPMLWEHLYDAIELCTKHHVLTDMTTNGTLLNDTTIQRLANAGLDYLNISVDTRDDNSVTKKRALFNDSIVKALQSAGKESGMKIRMNSVIHNNNFEDIKLVLERSKEIQIPLSLGFIVPDVKDGGKENIYFTEADFGLLEEIVQYILQKKKEKYPVIDPDSYFTNVFRFIKHERFWKCNYPTKYGWINVTANGVIRSCTKKMDETDFDFLSLTPEKIKMLKKTLQKSTKECNPYCYSNCAYYSSFYKKNKVAFLIDNIKLFYEHVGDSAAE